MADTFRIASAGIVARISAHGAELQSLQNTAGHEFMWQAGPEWPRHAPVLFPIVGQLAHDTLRHADKTYPLGRHGFARESLFAMTEQTATGCLFAITDSEATWQHYPFAFRFEVAYIAEGATLSAIYTITNTGEQTLPASMGAHPAFRWPLAGGIAKTLHRVAFEQPEPAPIRRLADGLVKPQPVPTPVEGRTLHLNESLFAEDALIFDQLASHSLRYEAPGAPGIEVLWEGFFELGIWMKPGADFLCIEPWAGYASPQDFDGEFAEKPGLLLIPPGEQRSATHRIRLLG